MLRVLVIAESEADQRLVCGLADRVILERGRCELDEVRGWTGVESGTCVLRWRDIKGLAAAHRPARLRTLGFRQGQSDGEDEATLHKALIVAELAFEGAVRTVIVSRDMDTRDPEARRASHVAAAGRGQEMGWKVIFAAACPMIEAWLLHGFEARDRHEEASLSSLRGELGFDPRTESHRLDAQLETAKKSAKRVLSALIEAAPGTDASERRDCCWQDAPLRILRDRGGHTGLAFYLQQVDSILVAAIRDAV